MNDIFQWLDELNEVIEQSPAFMGLRFVNEERFYVRFQIVRTGVEAVGKPPASRPLSKEHSTNDAVVLQRVDELEQMVENSKGGFMGKRMINEEEFFTKIQQLRSALKPKGFDQPEPLQTHRSSHDLIAWARTLPREEQEKIVAALSGR